MNPSQDRYGRDLPGGPSCHPRAPASKVAAELELVVMHALTGRCGPVVAVQKPGGLRVSHREDRHGRTKAPLGPGFLLAERPVLPVPPPSAATTAARDAARHAGARRAGDSRSVPGAPARKVLASRISHADLEPARPGRVEELLDVVMLGARA